ncbi:DUF1772 domain-containing protein [Enhydrobacter sp.]|jgi:hypothetical protein|uniref:DUF1772 domain-containing protein n=1 Tax=Enhydrobacter sp. TaxID=1894999 RepID=UPI0026199316|nr:DUF1772 domain-containing protein [Enhydrobacter sp.]WIM10805.1 MAG: hypothetical protein OJF58_001761 [Enhydrobacter sp.]
MSRRACDAAFFVALLATALALGAALAHALELPNKIGLGKDEYFIVQQIYRGWSWLGVLLLVELVSIATVIVAGWRTPSVRASAIAALVCLIGAQALFWTFTYPANAATNNWTIQPDNWQALRLQWEYSHATGAALQIAAMASLIRGALARSGDR